MYFCLKQALVRIFLAHLHFFKRKAKAFSILGFKSWQKPASAVELLRTLILLQHP